jgi:hypothetical protein
VPIAHALGASGLPQANRLQAFQASLADGFRHFEVDIWLDDQRHLRCHHGNSEAGSPPLLTAGDCTLETLLPLLVAAQGWLVLDIKTDFEATGRRIVDLLRGQLAARQVVFQLYRPAHLALFADWAAELPLPAPIVTVYAAHRGVQHIADHLRALNVQVLTLPLDKTGALLTKPAGVALLVHPVHDCAAWARAVGWGAQGVYTLQGLRCP